MKVKEPSPASKRNFPSHASEFSHEDREVDILVGYTNATTLQGEPYPKPILARKMGLDEKGLPYSDIVRRTLISPFEITADDVMFLSHRGGIHPEDPRTTRDYETGEILTTIIEYKEATEKSAANAGPRLVITDPTLQKVHSNKYVGPRIPIKRAISWIKNQRVRTLLARNLEHTGRVGRDIGTALIDLKDCIAYRVGGEYHLQIRLEPNIYVARAKDWRHFMENDFWEEHLRDLDNNSVFYASESASKVGGGSPLLRRGDYFEQAIHEVFEVRERAFDYYGTFIRIDPETGKAVSVLRNHLLKPEGRRFEFQDAFRKRICFPTIFDIHPETEESLVVGYGVADNKFAMRTISSKWYDKEMSHPGNKVAA